MHVFTEMVILSEGWIPALPPGEKHAGVYPWDKLGGSYMSETNKIKIEDLSRMTKLKLSRLVSKNLLFFIGKRKSPVNVEKLNRQINSTQTLSR